MITDVTITTHGPASIIAAQELEERQQKSATIEYSNFSDDTVTISQEAREMQKAAAGGETGSLDDKPQQNSLGMGSENKEDLGGTSSSTAIEAGAEQGGTAADNTIELLKQQIAEVQKKLEKARAKLEKLMAAQAEKDTSAKSGEEGKAIEDSPEVKAAQMEINELSSQLATLNSQLNANVKGKMNAENGSSYGMDFGGGASGKILNAKNAKQVWVGVTLD